MSIRISKLTSRSIDLGRTFDLVGTGKAESASFITGKINDAIASFFWREVDLVAGVVEMFDDLDYTGIRQALYLSEWPSDTFINIDKWHMNDRMTSIKWESLFDKQTAHFYADPNGGGAAFNQVISWGSTKGQTDLRKFGFDDTVSCFDWSPLIPKLEEIAPFNINTTKTADQTVGESVEDANHTDQPGKITLSVEQKVVATLTTTTTESHVVGITTKIEPPIGIGFSVELSYQYKKENTKSATDTHESTAGISREITTQAQGLTKASLIASIGSIPTTAVTTTATRWYDVPVNGGVLDPTHNNWYKRENETVNIVLAGGIGLAANVVVTFDPYTKN